MNDKPKRDATPLEKHTDQMLNTGWIFGTVDMIVAVIAYAIFDSLLIGFVAWILVYMLTMKVFIDQAPNMVKDYEMRRAAQVQRAAQERINDHYQAGCRTIPVTKRGGQPDEDHYTAE